MHRATLWLILTHVSFIGLLVDLGWTRGLVGVVLYNAVLATWYTFRKEA